MKKLIFPALFALVAAIGASFGCSQGEQSREILNVSYDPTRELYESYNQMFADYWKKTTGETILVEKSNGGSGRQARAVKTGQEADVVTLALAFDIDDVASGGLFAEGADDPTSEKYWQKRLPNNSCPYTSTIVILVRKGNPKNIKNWDDLTRPDVAVVTPNPKTSGGARWNYLALWGFALDKELADVGGIAALEADPNAIDSAKLAAAQDEAYKFVKKVFANAVKQGMQEGARSATDDFVKNGVGDAFLAWENEAILSKIYSKDELEIVVPSVTVKAEPPVAVVDKQVDRRGTRDIAEAYLEYLYQPEAQELIAQNHYRPYLPEVAEKYREKFPETLLFTVDGVFGGWLAAQRAHFNSDGKFDQMIAEIAKEN